MSHLNMSFPFDRTNSSQEATARTAIQIFNLPKSMDREGLKNMLICAKDCVYAEFVSSSAVESGSKTAIVQFENRNAAEEIRSTLNGKKIGDAILETDFIQISPGMSASWRGGRPSDPVVGNKQSRYNGFSPNAQRSSPPRPSNGVNGDSAHADGYNGVFAPQSALGQPLERLRVSGKSVIGNDEDEETGKLLNDPIAFARNDVSASSLQPQQPRRPTLGQLPSSAMNALSISSGVTSPTAPSLMSPRGSMQSPTAFSPSAVPGMGINGYPTSPQPYPRTQMPPVNPADQNPPCNTLYVGNLPQDTSEDELKMIFSKQRGYRRMCFRTKANGPMCFVEFEDVSCATKTLKECYGQMLSNSIRTGIRLSFSKNPLGVRSGQHNGLVSPLSPQGPMSGMNGFGSTQPFASANGPPPGLRAPPGFAANGQNGHSPYSPNGNSGMNGSSGHSPMSPNGFPLNGVRSPTAGLTNGAWNLPNGNNMHQDYLYGR